MNPNFIYIYIYIYILVGVNHVRKLQGNRSGLPVEHI